MMAFGMHDARYDKSVHDLLSTFFARTFKNMIPLVLEVLEKMKTEYARENGTICVSFGPVDLFKFMNEVYDLSMACFDPVVQKGTLNLIQKMLTIFQFEFKKVMAEAEDMDMEIFCALTNSNIKFIAAARSLTDKVKKFDILKEEEIMTVCAGVTVGIELLYAHEELRPDIQQFFQKNRTSDSGPTHDAVYKHKRVQEV